ncbi:MAG: zf-HC2 domain-containing protein [Planctomycetes bacterium]|nr:zf-HC2 domain-containing protein [Planctomycetota bacterium]MBI3844472.1 zf-HC2 domain-containing protein [Planctomycetota bacterium]
MRCNQALDLVSRRIDNELAFEEREVLLEHLKGCENCRAYARACEEDAFRIRRVLRFFRPKKAEFIQRTIALITEHEEPHREIAPTEEPASRSASWKYAAAFTIPAAAAVIAFCAYQLFAPPSNAELQRWKGLVADQQSKIHELERGAEARGDVAARRAERTVRSGNEGQAKPLISEGTPERLLASSNVSRNDPNDDGARKPGEIDISPAIARLDRVQAQMQTLLDALDQDDLTKAMTIAQEIGNAFNEVATLSGQLATRLTDMLNRPNVDNDDRVALLGMLAKIHTDVTASYFRDELAKGDSQSNVSLRRALAEGLALNADDSLATHELLKSMMWGADEDHEVRTAAARGLVQIALNSSDSDPFFREVMALALGPNPVQDPRLRIEIIQILAGTPGAPGIVDFLNTIARSSSDHDERVAAIDSLGALPSESALSALNELLNDAHMPPDLRSRARGRVEHPRTPPRSSHRDDDRRR